MELFIESIVMVGRCNEGRQFLESQGCLGELSNLQFVRNSGGWCFPSRC